MILQDPAEAQSLLIFPVSIRRIQQISTLSLLDMFYNILAASSGFVEGGLRMTTFQVFSLIIASDVLLLSLLTYLKK